MSREFVKDEELTTVQDDFGDNDPESNSAKEETFKSLLEKSQDIIDKINALTTQEYPCLIIDYDFLLDNPECDKYFLLNNSEFVKNVRLLGGAALEIYKEHHNNDTIDFNTRVRINDPLLSKPLRSIGTKNIGKGVMVSTGTVNTISEMKPVVVEPWSVCSNCNLEEEGRGARKCPNCGENTFKMKISKSKLTEYQFLEIQETVSNDKNGSSTIPVVFTLKLYGPDLVGQFNPGDNIRFSAAAKLEKTPGPQQTLQQDEEFSQDILFDMVLEALYVEKIGKVNDEKLQEKLSKKEIDYIHRLRADNTDKSLTELLVSSFASHIYGEDIIKESLLIQLASQLMLHVLLVGSPSTGKSQMAKFGVKVSPIGMFSAGKGSSGVGLTASTIPDKSGVMKLGIGPIVMCDRGIVGVDEVDKLTEDHQYYLLESMEEGTVTVNKGGINTVLNARTSVVVIANPKQGHYDEEKNLVDNVKIPVPLLTRFDLIFILKDKPDEEKDLNIVKHIGKVFSKMSKENGPQPINQRELDFLRKYIKYIKTVLPPTEDITSEVTNLMEEYYPKLRQSGVESNTTTITPRQVYGLYSMAVARSRLLLKEKVDKSDMERAIVIMNYVMQGAGIDVNTGKVDVGVLNRMPIHKMGAELMFREVMYRLTKMNTEAVPRDQIVDSLIEDGKKPLGVAEQMFETWYKSGRIIEPKQGYFKLT